MAELFVKGNPEKVRKLNLIVQELNALNKMTGDVFIRVANTPAGATVRLNIDTVLERIMKNNRPFKHGHALGFHGGGTSLAVISETLTTIPIDFTTSDPDGWLDSDGFVVPADGVYFASAAFWVVYGTNPDVPAYVVGRNVTGAVNLLKSVPEVTLPAAVGLNVMLFHINGMITLEKDELFQFMFWHEGGSGATMEMSNSLGAHAGLWLIDRINP